jgi:hypothetical protein
MKECVNTIPPQSGTKALGRVGGRAVPLFPPLPIARKAMGCDKTRVAHLFIYEIII